MPEKNPDPSRLTVYEILDPMDGIYARLIEIRQSVEALQCTATESGGNQCRLFRGHPGDHFIPDRSL